MKFYILFVFAFSSIFDTSNANYRARMPKITMCVLVPEVLPRSLSHEEYAQVDIRICQPHEVCSPMSGEVNRGKYGLG